MEFVRHSLSSLPATLPHDGVDGNIWKIKKPLEEPNLLSEVKSQGRMVRDFSGG